MNRHLALTCVADPSTPDDVSANVSPQRIESAAYAPCDVVEPWQPKVGDYVMVRPSPECRAWHSQRGPELRPRFGVVEEINRAYPDPDRWVAIIPEVGREDYSEEEALQDARDHRGHFYLVQDCLNTERVAYLDGYYAAMELTPVDRVTALLSIAAARKEWARLSPDERLYRLLFGDKLEALL